MTTVLDNVRRTIGRYSLLQPGDHVAVAVSGGADSLCLLHILLELRSEFALQLSVVHVDHNLRGPESQADAEFVHKSAQQLGLPFHFRKLDLHPRRGNLEQEARRARYGFFSELIEAGLAQKIALGHTRSDQAETVLFRLLRGAGSAGLAGIRPVTSSPPVIRPLLGLTRPDVETWLIVRGISWRQDHTNADLRFDRNRIRHRLLPSLQQDWNPALADSLAQTADWAFEEERYWQDQLPVLTAEWVRFFNRTAILDRKRLNALPIAAARRVIRYCIQRVKDDLLGVTFAHIEIIRDLAAQPGGAGEVRLPGLKVRRSFDWLRFAKHPEPRSIAPEALETGPFCVSVPGTYVISPTTIELELLPNDGVYNRDVNTLDWDSVGGPLVLRGWRAGDRYRRPGRVAPEKLKEIFHNARIPLWERHNWPIMTVGESIIWTSRFGPAAHCAVDGETRTVLRVRETAA